MNRTDIYNTAADVALETAISTLLALDSPADGVKPASITRKEALRFLSRRLLKKEVGNKTRLVAANTPGLPQS